jgi:hypothetical protein
VLAQVQHLGEQVGGDHRQRGLGGPQAGDPASADQR